MIKARALLFLALTAATLLAYQPAWQGGMLWDDEGHLTRPELRSAGGFVKIWTTPGATQQYYPVVHSAFWLFHRAWGDDTRGYHLANILLHATSAFLLFLILMRLAIPGALLAAFIFALHPVHVESVAWMTELKNVLSGVFYLAAALVYLSQPVKGWPTGEGGVGRPTGEGSVGRPFTGRRGSPTGESVGRPTSAASVGWSTSNGRVGRPFTGRRGAALLLFVLAVLAKSVTATLPVALLIVGWWQRGRLRWREDVRPLVPFVLLGIAAGAMTIWMERTFIGARGAGFDLTLVQRPLLACRAVWFYLGKLLWPADLTFIYPRWSIDPASAAAWVPVLALAAAVIAAWLTRARSRAPLAALLFFIVSLAPALGFVDVYPFRFSFVADHFQYLASIGPIALFAAAFTVVVSPQRHGGTENAFQETVFSLKKDSLCLCVSVVIGLSLALLTWRQSHDYANAETLYRATIARNPSAWIARNNLAALVLAAEPAPERVAEARAQLEEAVRLKLDYAEAHYNLGTAFERQGDMARASEEYAAVLRLDPGQPRALQRLAVMRIDRASRLLQEGLAREAAGEVAAAERAYREAASLDPGRAIIRRSLGRALQRLGRNDEAVAEYRAALALEDTSAETHNDLGVLLAQAGRLQEAIVHFERAVQLDPADTAARENLMRAKTARAR